MNSCCKKLILLAVLIASMGTQVFGQDWKKPAPNTQNKDVPCDTSSCDPGEKGKLLIGYPAPITAFVGRYLDSVKTEITSFIPFRPARAKNMRLAPERKRIYTMIGSALCAYDTDTFFTRLAAGEELASVAQLPIEPRVGTVSGRKERVLQCDRFFYAENKSTGWITNAGDGEDKLFAYDWDDRGYVYLAAGPYSWGIARDDGGTGGTVLMPSLFQWNQPNPSSNDQADPNRILSVKTSAGNYYAYVGNGDSDYKPINVWNTNNPASPALHKYVPGIHFAYRDFAKSTDGSRIALLTIGNAIAIYSADNLVDGKAPILLSDKNYRGITSDGTNFFAAGINASQDIVITVFSPTSGGSYSVTPHVVPGKFSSGGAFITTNKDAGGYIVVIPFEQQYSGQGNVRLYKLNNLVPVEVPLNAYTARHYTQAAPAGYIYGGKFSKPQGAHVFKKGSKYYLIVELYGLGDVYEIKGSDSITAKIKKLAETPNPNAQTPPATAPFFGDLLTFTSEHSSSSAPSVKWNFGDGVEKTATPSVPDVAHDFRGLTAGQLANLPLTLTVNAENPADSSMNDSLTIKLLKPTPRVAVSGTSLLFTQPTAANATNLPAVVSSDLFVDASDGSVESHTSEWQLGTDTAVKKRPNETFGVGPIGERSLHFTGHYGAYSTSTLTPIAASVDYGINPIRYVVRPFVPAVTGPTVTGANVIFKNGTRVTTNTADLPGGSSAQVNYTWELLNASGAVVGTAVVGPAPVAISAIPDYSIAKSALSGAQDWKARLTITLVTPTPQYASGSADSSLLNSPTPGEIAKTGCDNVGSPCSLNVPSTRADIDPASWTYAWTVTGPGSVPASTAVVYSPQFSQAGSYTVTVKVSNAIAEVTKTIQLTLSAPVCSSNPSAPGSFTSVGFSGPTSGCNGPSTNCGVGEAVAFRAQPFRWTTMPCDKYSWNFGDGTAASTEFEPVHAYNAAGTYTVTLNIDGGLSDTSATTQV